VTRNRDGIGDSTLTVHRRSAAGDWLEAEALSYDYVEWARGWTGIDLVAERPQMRAELACLAGQYATGAEVSLAVWQSLTVGAVAIRLKPTVVLVALKGIMFTSDNLDSSAFRTGVQ
jgi:hypothetical protein